MKQYTCIVCPNSCLIEAEETADGILVSGNQCKRGEIFAVNEYTCPMRMFTSTVRMEGGTVPRLSVISDAEIPKSELKKCQEELMRIVIHAPVKCGEIIVNDICGTGVNIVASRTLDGNQEERKWN